MNIIKILLAAMAVLIVELDAQGQGSGTPPLNNYIKSRTIAKPNVIGIDLARTLTSPYDVFQQVQYYDGLGRPIQTVTMQQSPLQKDMVSINVYDVFGREATKYLPYASVTNDGNYKINPLLEQNSFNAALFPNQQYYYGQQQFEPSPLNRVQQTLAPGINWIGAGRGVATNYLVNTATEGVKVWIIADAVGSVPTTSTVYGDGQLYVTASTDENNNKVLEYKDLTGQIILKKVQAITSPGVDHTGWLCTYYVYDIYNQLRFVISPRQ